jgi:hypothetical protein
VSVNELYGTNPNVIAFLSPAAPFSNNILLSTGKIYTLKRSSIRISATMLMKQNTLECVFSFQ